MMDFKDLIRVIGERVTKMKDNIKTEEATKNAFIMPFIQALGYDIFDPTEVVPEFVADIGSKKGEKVDYAIMKDDQPIMLIECKHWSEKLEVHNNQLVRYFNVTKSRFGILTNGIRYRFYTDMVEPNIMDALPFMDFEITELKEHQIEELKKFHKSYFDVANILSSASEMKYVGEIKNILQNELKAPSEEFVKFFASKVFKGRVTEKVVFQFSEFVRKAAHGVVSDYIQDRLKTALDNEKVIEMQYVADQTPAPTNTVPPTQAEASNTPNAIVTTQEELEGYWLVKSILRTKVDTNRIFYRDTVNYFNIILDDNIRKTICRLYMNGTKKYLAIFDENKKEQKNEITNLDDIYKFSEQLNMTLETYLNLKG